MAEHCESCGGHSGEHSKYCFPIITAASMDEGFGGHDGRYRQRQQDRIERALNGDYSGDSTTLINALVEEVRRLRKTPTQLADLSRQLKDVLREVDELFWQAKQQVPGDKP